MRSVLLIILMLGVLGDVITTYVGITRFGCIVERNPITRTVCLNYGRVAVVVGGLWEFTILYLLFKLYELKAREVLREVLMTIVSLLPYVAVVNNLLFLISH